jgi:hypothetical protein
LNKLKSIVNFKWLDNDNNIFYGDKFEGGLLQCTESCDESWGKLASKWCAFYDDVKDLADDTNGFHDPLFYKALEDPAHSICILYAVLFYGSGVYLAFEILALISIVSWALGMFMYWRKVKCCLVCSMICSGCVWFGHYTAFIFFMVFTKTNFQGNCDEFEDDGENPKLCASDGPGVALVVAILIPLVAVTYCVVGCNLNNKYGHDGLKKNHLENHGNLDQIHVQGAFPVYPAAYPAAYPIGNSSGYQGNPTFPTYPANPSYPSYPVNPSYPGTSVYPPGEYKGQY